MNRLTEQQSAVLAADPKAHLMVRARAGTGKTWLLGEIARASKPADGRLLYATFNAAAAEHARSALPPHVKVGTLHSLGLAALPHARYEATKARRHARLLGVPPKLVAHVMSLTDAAKDSLTDDLPGLADSYGYDSDAVCPWVVKLMDSTLRDRAHCDYTDMLWLPYAYGIPVARGYARLLVDEVQDLSPLQRATLLACDTPIVGVGDDRQAIYGWRGAYEAYDKLAAALGVVDPYPLTVSWRCSRAVVDYARTLVPDLEARPDAPTGEVRDVADCGGAGPGDLVLARFNRTLAALSRDVWRRGESVDVSGRLCGDALRLLNQLSPASPTALRAALKPRLARKPGQAVLSLDALLAGRDSLRAIRLELTAPSRTDVVRLMTVHAAKGLEADRVWVMQDSLRSPTGDPAEELNVAYVAYTRAKESLLCVTRD